jgi:hypothetical protein
MKKKLRTLAVAGVVLLVLGIPAAALLKAEPSFDDLVAQERPHVPAGISPNAWVAAALRVGVDLEETRSDRLGVHEGFKFSQGDYPSLASFTRIGARNVRHFSSDVVESRHEFSHSSGGRLFVEVSLVQTTPLDARRLLLAKLLRPTTQGRSAPRPASEAGLDVGDTAATAQVPPGDQAPIRDVVFARRNVIVTLFRSAGRSLDVGALALAMDAEIEQRPLISDLALSSLRPTIAQFEMDSPSTGVDLQIKGDLSFSNPSSGQSFVRLHSLGGVLVRNGSRLRYYPQTAMLDTLSARVSNELNILASMSTTVLVR